MQAMDQLILIGHVVAAAALGGLIGLEREWAGKPAGLRTHMLIGGASALLMLLGEVIINHFAESAASDIVDADPIRIMQAIIIGVSFLGAGTIVTNDRAQRIEGLTTAASVLLTTGIGITVALSQWILAVGVTVIALVVLFILSYAERQIGGAREQSEARHPSDEDS